MSDEIRKILDMVENDTITKEEGEQLIEAIYEKEAPKKNMAKNSTLRVRIDAKGDNGADKATVKVNLPLVLAKKMSGLTRLVPKNAKEDLTEQGIDLDSIDLAELIEMFENGEIEEDLVNIEAGEGDDATTVRIYVD